MHLREVQVFDMNGNNVALDKAATQSSTQGDYTAKKAVDGIITQDDSNRQTTDSEKGMLYMYEAPYV